MFIKISQLHFLEHTAIEKGVIVPDAASPAMVNGTLKELAGKE
jgi:hypothetical protein